MNTIKKKMLLTITTIFGLLILFVLGYILHVLFSYNRLEDDLIIPIENVSQIEEIDISNEYTISTYNIGFGAYSQNYSFFMDTGETKEGKSVKGKYAKAVSNIEEPKNLEKIISEIKNTMCPKSNIP